MMGRTAVMMAGALALAACNSGQGDAPAQGDSGAQPGASGAAGTQAAPAPPEPAVSGPLRHVVALGDSLLAGYGLRPEQAYPPRLEAALRAAGINARVVNAGVSGDTTADGLARLDFTLGSVEGGKIDLVLLSLGGNDMLRGLPVAQTRANMDAILTKLEARHIPVVVLGMMAAPNMGADYGKAFDAIDPELARKHHAALVPFFMAPINGKPGLQLPDHIHPTPQGVEAMVKATLPTVQGALAAEPSLPM
jgi:acyl-CoA thioesterase I